MANVPVVNVSVVPAVTPEPIAVTNPIKSFVSDVLRLSPSLDKCWDIVDVYPKDDNAVPQLALAHYNDNYDKYNRIHEPLRSVRGIIIDLNTGAIVCGSYGYTQSLSCYGPLSEEISPSNPDGIIEVSTEVAMYINSVEIAPEESAKIAPGVRKFDKSKTKLFLGYEGAMIRIFKWNGIVFFSTHKRIDASKSSWGGRMPFLDLYKELKGADPASFFGNELYSPYCYMFLIAHNEIRLATSTRDNRIIFIGMKKVWDPEVFAGEGKPYFWSEEYPIRIPAPSDSEPESTFSNDQNRPLIIQPSVDVDTANKFLFPNKFAKDFPDNDYLAKEHEIVVEYKDNSVSEVYFKRTGPTASDVLSGGDFVILYTTSSEGQTVVYRLEPAAFEYRVDVTGNDPCLYHRFAVKMVDFTKAVNPKELTDEYPRYSGEDGKDMSLVTPSDRQRYWWSLFYDAVAPAYKDEVDGFYKRYTTDIERVANFIISRYPAIIKLDPKSEELKRISDPTRLRFDKIRDIGVHNRAPGQSSFVTIRNLLYKETGPSLYKMITTVKNLEKLRDKVATTVTN